MTPTTENPYPGLQIPKNVLFNTNITNIQLKEQHSNPPIYPDDYLFNTSVEVRDLSNNYSIATINNEVKTVDAWTDYNQTDDIEDLGNGLLRVTSFCPEDENDPSNNLYANQIERIINISQYQQVIQGHILKRINITLWRNVDVALRHYDFLVQDWTLSNTIPVEVPYQQLVFDPVTRIFYINNSSSTPLTFDHSVWIIGNSVNIHADFSRNYMYFYIIDQENLQVVLKTSNESRNTTFYESNPLPLNWVPDYPTTP